MAHVITEVDAFTASITVPDAGDARSDAAEVVADIAQRLANRTKNLQRLDSEKAELAAANVFTAAQTITVPNVTGDDWKLILKADKIRVYTSLNPGAAIGGLGIAYNAEWINGTPGHWSQIDGTHFSNWWVINYGELYAVAMPSSSGTWTAWPVLGAGLKGDVWAGRDVHAGRNVVLGGEVLRAAPIRRTTLLNLDEAQGAVLRLDASGRITFDTSAPAGSVEISIAVKLPAGSVIIGADVLVNKHDAANPPTVKFRARPAVSSDFTSPAAINMFTRDTAVGAGSTGMEALHLDPSAGGGGYAVDPTEEYQITFARGGGLTAVTDEVHAIRVIWDDYGLRND
jgi:hypothetical protein